jgi:glucose/mannose transport system substrate-binding protein
MTTVSINMPGKHINRRSVLASIGGWVSVGLAGCTGGGGGDDDDGGDGDSPEVASTTTGTQEGGTPESIIPGEVVHNENEAARILDYWGKGDGFIMIRIRNTGDKQLQLENLDSVETLSS